MMELVDENDAVYPVKETKVCIEVNGVGTLQGLGSAATKTCEGFFESNYTTYQGRALVAIRAGYEAGEISVTVSAEGFETQTLSIEVI